MAATASIVNARKTYSIENNNDTQTLTFTVKRTSGSTYWQDKKSLIFKLIYDNDDGTKTTLSQTVQFNFPSGSVGASKSTSVDFVVPHKSDGTQSITYEASIATGTSVGTLNPKGSAKLETIPRASSITVNDANIGSSTNIVINKASENFTTTLRYRALKPDETWTDWSIIVTKSGFKEVYGWTVPTSLYSLIPNNQTIVCEFEATTFSDDTQVGSPTYARATFTATGNPIINNISATDINSVTANLTEGTSTSSKMVRYASNVQIVVSATRQNGSSISSIMVNGVACTLSGSSSDATRTGTVTINGVSTNSFQIVVVDSRGYTSTQTKTMTMIEYVPLTLNANIDRNTPTDGKVNIEYSGNYFNGNFGSQNNALIVQYRSRIKGGTWGSWTNLSPNISGNTYSQSTTISGYTYTNQYEFEMQAFDEIQTKPITGITVAKGKPIFNWADELFNVYGEYYQNDVLLSDIYLAKDDLLNKVYPVGSIYMSVNSTSPATLFGGTWAQLKDRFLLGSGNTYTNGSTGGEASHTLTTNELPDMGSFLSLNWKDQNTYNTGIFGDGGMKTQDRTASSGSSFGEHWTTLKGGEQAHNNMPPYLVVYMWKRTA
jgi:hypothetical protein